MQKLVLVLILIGVFPIGLLAQKKTNSAEQDRPIKLKTDLIELRAVVTDSAGKLVDNLTKDDFEVLENGREQQIAFFGLEKVSAPTSTQFTVPRAPGNANLNRPQVNVTPRRTLVFFVDTMHLSNENYLRSRQMLRKFIDQQLNDDDLVAVISSGGPMGIFNQFTQNRAVMLSAVEKLRPWGVRHSRFTPYIANLVVLRDAGAIKVAIDIVNQEEFTSDTTANEVDGRARNILAETAAWRTSSLRTLEAAMDRMAQMPGQRMVFLISDGFSLQDIAGNAHGDLNRVTSRAVRSGILIYSIDAKGLETDLEISDQSSKFAVTPSIRRYLVDSKRDEEDALNAMGKDTGGDAFFNNNDMQFLMKKALDSNGVYYALAYYPSLEKADKSFRKLTVRVKNHPEYKVRTQKGYQPPDPKVEEQIAKQTPQQAVLKAISAPLPQTDIGVSAAAYYLETDVDESQVTMEVFIDGGSLEYPKQDGRSSIDCEVTTAVFDQTGKSIRILADKIQGELTPERLEEGRKNGYRYLKRLELKPGTYQVRIGVRENGSERIGTAGAFVEVPNLQRSKLAISSIVLASRLNAGEGAVQVNVAASPLQMPSFRHGVAYFRAGTSMVYQLTVYQNAGTKPTESALVMQSELIQGEQTVYRSAWQPITERILRMGRKGFDAGGQINLDLKAGLYELRLTIRDPKTNRTVQQTVLFQVEA